MQTNTYSEINKLVSLARPLTVINSHYEGDVPLKELCSDAGRLMHVFFHGSSVGQAAIINSFPGYMEKHGFGERVPLVVAHDILFKIPGLNYFTRKMNAAPLDRDGYEALLEECNHTDFIIFPEGDNCFFSDGLTVEDFRSTAFLEYALKFDMKIITYSYVGANTVLSRKAYDDINPLGKRILKWVHPSFDERAEGRNIFYTTFKPIEDIKCAYAAYKPLLTYDKLHSDPGKRKAQLLKEGVRLAKQMQKGIDKLVKKYPEVS